MAVSQLSAMRVRFGRYEFDEVTHALWRDGAPARLAAQPAQVLALLVERAGQIVTRDELRQAVWGADTFVDFDRGLNFCVSQVRSALHDDAAEPIYIRTVAKQGYQFIAPVERLAGAEQPALPQINESSRWRAAALTAISLLLLVGAAALWSAARPLKQPPAIAVFRFDNETGNAAATNASDALTDNVVERLTAASMGRYDVIGNAQVLRLPREQRDLRAVGASLGAAYVVLGQLQREGDTTRILVHLIRTSDQKHLGVVRVERVVADPLTLQSEVAAKVAERFAPRIIAEANGARLPGLPSR